MDISEDVEQIMQELSSVLQHCEMASTCNRTHINRYYMSNTRHILQRSQAEIVKLKLWCGVPFAIASNTEMVIEFLKKYPNIALSCTGMRQIGVVALKNKYPHYHRVACLKMSVDYESVWDQIDCVDVRRVEEVGIRKNVCIEGDISVRQIREMHDVEFIFSTDVEFRLLDLSDISINEVRRINFPYSNSTIPGPMNVIKEFVCSDYENRNKFIDQLFEAGYEEWI